MAIDPDDHFGGNEDAAQKISVLYTLAVSAAANGVNPLEYLTDVLMRIQSHANADLDDLLPHRWKPPASVAARGTGSAVETTAGANTS